MEILRPVPARNDFTKPLLFAVGLNLGLFCLGFLSRPTTFQEMLMEARRTSLPPPAVEEKVLQIDFSEVPPPETMKNPEFSVPVEEPKVEMPVSPPEEIPPPLPEVIPPIAAPEPPVAEKPVVESPVSPTPQPPEPFVAEPQKENPLPAPVALPAPAVVIPEASPPAPESPSLTSESPSRPKPAYPIQAKLRRQQGTVLLAVEVEAGHVLSATVVRSSGVPLLDAEARKWVVKIWRFPERPLGRLSLQVPVTFRLEEVSGTGVP